MNTTKTPEQIEQEVMAALFPSQEKVHRPIEEVREEVSQIRGTKVGIAPAGEVSQVWSDKNYHGRGVKVAGLR